MHQPPPQAGECPLLNRRRQAPEGRAQWSRLALRSHAAWRDWLRKKRSPGSRPSPGLEVDPWREPWGPAAAAKAGRTGGLHRADAGHALPAHSNGKGGSNEGQTPRPAPLRVTSRGQRAPTNTSLPPALDMRAVRGPRARLGGWPGTVYSCCPGKLLGTRSAACENSARCQPGASSFTATLSTGDVAPGLHRSACGSPRLASLRREQSAMLPQPQFTDFSWHSRGLAAP